MNILRSALSVLVSCLVGFSAASEPPAADVVIKQAVRAAKQGHKGVLVVFHASWCGWCKQLDKTFEVPQFKAVLDKDYVVVHLTVLENPAHKADVNPGGEDLLDKVGGKDGGIPYFFTLNSSGRIVADSRVVEGKENKLQNMGFPTEAVEIHHFLDMLKLANPSLDSSDSATLESVLEARATEIKSTQHR
jgi:thiol-disulfide isomerase/thioredoxin